MKTPRSSAALGTGLVLANLNLAMPVGLALPVNEPVPVDQKDAVDLPDTLPVADADMAPVENAAPLPSKDISAIAASGVEPAEKIFSAAPTERLEENPELDSPGDFLPVPSPSAPLVSLSDVFDGTAQDSEAEPPTASPNEIIELPPAPPGLNERTVPDIEVDAANYVPQEVSRRHFLFPLSVPAPVSSAFGWRIHPISGKRQFHAGVDLAAPTGTPVLASHSGRVVAAREMRGYGLTVILEQPGSGYRTLYAHLSRIFVRPGVEVIEGEVLGHVGSTGLSTGPHLHFETQYWDSGWKAIAPVLSSHLPLLPFINAPVSVELPTVTDTAPDAVPDIDISELNKFDFSGSLPVSTASIPAKDLPVIVPFLPDSNLPSSQDAESPNNQASTNNQAGFTPNYAALAEFLASSVLTRRFSA